MIDFLYSIPEAFLLALSALLFAALILVLPLLVQRLPLLRGSDANSEFLARMQAPLFTMTALVLAFTLVQAEANFRYVDSQVTAEASQINQLDRLLTRYGTEEAGKVRPMLHAYARSIVTDEWPQMLKDGRSEKTRLAFSSVSQGVMAFEPQPGRQSLIYAEMLKQLDAIAQARETRLDNVEVGLPAIYWEVIAFAVVILLVVTSTFVQTPYRRAVLTAQMSLLGAFVGLTFLMDQPFKGETAIFPGPIEHVINAMEHRDR